MNQPIRRVALFCFLLIVSLLVSSNYLQVVNADSYKARPGNQRNLYDAYAFPRGVIRTADGVVIAQSAPVNGLLYKYQRSYPLGPAYANVVGYKSIIYGSYGIESSLDKFLQGNDSSEAVSNFLDTLTGKTKKGGDVQLTIDNAVQQAAINGLAGRTGSVVALDPDTGAILAMYSNPTFDPNKIASNDGKVSKAAGEALSNDKDKPNLNHAIGETYFPGSVFKVITATAALESGKFTENDPTGAPPDRLTFPGGQYSIANENGEQCPGTDLKSALAASCNSVFGWVGDQLGVAAINDTATKFGLNGTGLKIPQTVVKSVFPADEASSQQSLAQASIGQFDTKITPLQAAMIAAAVANGGTIMKPYLVQKEVSPRGGTTFTAKPEVFSQAMSPQAATAIDDMMVNVVTSGTAQGRGIDGAHMGAKTGTAQRATNQNPLAWFISYASLNGKKVAVAVLVQDDDAAKRQDITGGGFAGPVAQAVMKVALGVGQG